MLIVTVYLVTGGGGNIFNYSVPAVICQADYPDCRVGKSGFHVSLAAKFS